MNSSGGGESLGHIDRCGHLAYAPVAPACLAACVVSFLSIAVDVLNACQLIAIIDGHHQSTVAGNSGPVWLDSFAGNVLMLAGGKPGLIPYCLHGVGCDLVALFNLRISCGFCLGHSPRDRHIFCNCQIAVDFCPKNMVHPQLPITESSGGYTVAISDIP